MVGSSDTIAAPTGAIADAASRGRGYHCHSVKGYTQAFTTIYIEENCKFG